MSSEKSLHAQRRHKNTQEKKDSIETDSEGIQVVEIAHKDFKTTIIDMPKP